MLHALLLATAIRLSYMGGPAVGEGREITLQTRGHQRSGSLPIRTKVNPPRGNGSGGEKTLQPKRARRLEGRLERGFNAFLSNQGRGLSFSAQRRFREFEAICFGHLFGHSSAPRSHGPSDSSSSNSAHTRVRLTFAWHRHELYSRRNNQTHCLSNKNALSHCFPSLLESDLEPADCAPKIRQPNLLRRLLHLPSVQGHLRLSYERADFVLLSPWRPTR